MVRRRATPTPMPTTGEDSDSSSQFSATTSSLRPKPSQPQQPSSPSSVLETTATTNIASGPQRQPRFKIGVLADIQYAPIPDGYSFAGTLRYYRHALEVARHAARHFQEDRADVVLNLGDIIDGKCQAIKENGGDPLPEGKDPGASATDDVLEALSHYRCGPIIHTYGNHELYNLDRRVIGEKLKIPFVAESCGDLVGYHTYSQRGMRFIVIDSYDVHKLGRCSESSQKYKQASNILAKENPNYPHNENSAEGLPDDRKRYVAFNGGVGEAQLEWLKCTLDQARELDEKVIILSHQPILPGSSSAFCLIWNYEDVLTILRQYNDIVVASFAGHAHSGGYKRDESGIHFRTFEAVLESICPNKTYSIVEVHDDCLVIQGFGNCESAVYDFAHLSVPVVEQ